MHRIDTPTAAAALPATKPAGTPGFFIDGNQGTGTPATQLDQDFFNMLQEELVNVVIASGQTLDKNNRGQLLAALQSLFASTGDAKVTLNPVAGPGWIVANDGSIGDAVSGATTRANNDTLALFTMVWNVVSNTWSPTQTSAGAPVARGASAAADFALHRRIVVPKVLGRALVIAGAGAGLTARAIGEILGEEAHVLTNAEGPIHNHGVNDPGHMHSEETGGIGGTPNGFTGGGIHGTQNTGSSVTGISIQDAGGGAAHNNMQPTSCWNFHIKL